MAHAKKPMQMRIRILSGICAGFLVLAGCAGNSGILGKGTRASSSSAALKPGERYATPAERKKHAAFLRKSGREHGNAEMIATADRMERGEIPYIISTNAQPPKKPTSRLFSCIKKPQSKKRKDQYSLIIKVSLSPDGRLKRKPEVITSLKNKSYKATASKLVREIRRCQPYKLSRIAKEHLHNGAVLIEFSSLIRPSPSDPSKAYIETKIALK